MRGQLEFLSTPTEIGRIRNVVSRLATKWK